MEEYFEYKLWSDFYIPAILCIAFIIVWLFIGMCKIFTWLKDKIQKKREREDELWKK